MLSIKADFDAAERMLSDLGRKQLPFATALALNDTAGDVKLAEEAEIERTFDRPTPFTKRALYLRRASKNRLVARVGVRRIQAEYLRLQVTGGTRRPAGQALIVPVGARLNKYGNLPKGALSRLKARKGVFVASRRKAKTAGKAPGIYQRTRARRGQPGGLKMLVAFEPRATYRARFRFGPLAMTEGRRVFEGHFVARLKQAIRTAR